jgi:hypothetical protein
LALFDGGAFHDFILRLRFKLEGSEGFTIAGVQFQRADYTETNGSLPQTGLIGLRIHGDGKALVRYRNIRIEEIEPGV